MRELPEALRDAGIVRPMIVTDSTLATSEVFAQVRRAAEGDDRAVFSDVRSDPDLECVQAAAEAMRAHQADGVVAVGGGSALDAGKAAAFLLRQTRPLWDFEDIGDNWRKANPNIPPVVAVPTTAGTGFDALAFGLLLRI